MQNEKSNNIRKLIQSSLKGNRTSQKLLYQKYFSYGMSIAMRYSKNREEAEEVLNDAYIKVFQNLHKYDFQRPFRAWFQRILVNTAIDRIRRNKKHPVLDEMNDNIDMIVAETSINAMSAQEILSLIQKLPPSYRAVFNLYVIDGYNHREIGEQLGISEGTSKSNLAIARRKLQVMYLELHQSNYAINQK